MKYLVRLVVVAALALATPAAAQPEAGRVDGHSVRPERRPFSEALVERLEVPLGFDISVFAQDLGQPRMLAVDREGVVYVTRPQQGDVIALTDTGAGQPPQRDTVVANLENVHGIALRGSELYMATPKQVFVLDRAAHTPPRLFLDGLPDGGQHPHRTLGFGPDGALYVAVGSSCNACQEADREHATLLRVDTDGKSRTIHATGLRNTIGFGWHPDTGELWGMDHGTDGLGDDRPPEEINRIAEGRDYGWPFCFGDRQVDPQIAEPKGEAAERAATKQAWCEKSEPPALGYAAHNAPIAMIFYDGPTFPDSHRQAAFVAMHGSWNRRPADGYKVVALHFEKGKPVRFEDFVTGFLSEDRTTHFGRPAGLAVAKDGALLVSDDANGVIYWVSYGSARIADPK